MSTTTPNFVIRNCTKLNFTTEVLWIDPSDWNQNNNRPDNNLNNVTVNQGQASSPLPENPKSTAFSSQFDLRLNFSSYGDNITFRVNMHDATATNDGPNHKWIHTEGSYRVSQYTNDDQHLYLTVSNISWMSNIDDLKSLTEITIPGTHDSGTSNGHDVVSDPYTKTQYLSIFDQLLTGIRFFDIRCIKKSNGRFDIYHGVIKISYLNFHDVLNQCKDFLKVYPWEVILMSIKNEDDANLYSTTQFSGKHIIISPFFHYF